MWIDNPDSPDLMPDSYANAGPELRGYMTGRSPFEIREPSYRDTRGNLRSTIDSQEAFSRIAGRDSPELPQFDMTEPIVAPLPDSYTMIQNAEAKIQKEIERNTSPFASLIEPVRRDMEREHRESIALKEFIEKCGLG
ncbi:hypothetical protein GF343_04595 [Candidatus Woesearchaeota archaeon]|nr:hypothetical protein [Candidatus Woesearchaeota archaeon]